MQQFKIKVNLLDGFSSLTFDINEKITVEKLKTVIFKHQSLLQHSGDGYLLGFGPSEEDLFTLEYVPIAIVHPKVKSILTDNSPPHLIEVHLFPRPQNLTAKGPLAPPTLNRASRVFPNEGMARFQHNSPTPMTTSPVKFPPMNPTSPSLVKSFSTTQVPQLTPPLQPSLPRNQTAPVLPQLNKTQPPINMSAFATNPRPSQMPTLPPSPAMRSVSMTHVPGTVQRPMSMISPQPSLAPKTPSAPSSSNSSPRVIRTLGEAPATASPLIQPNPQLFRGPSDQPMSFSGSGSPGLSGPNRVPNHRYSYIASGYSSSIPMAPVSPRQTGTSQFQPSQQQFTKSFSPLTQSPSNLQNTSPTLRKSPSNLQNSPSPLQSTIPAVSPIKAPLPQPPQYNPITPQKSLPNSPIRKISAPASPTFDNNHKPTSTSPRPHFHKSQTEIAPLPPKPIASPIKQLNMPTPQPEQKEAVLSARDKLRSIIASSGAVGLDVDEEALTQRERARKQNRSTVQLDFSLLDEELDPTIVAKLNANKSHPQQENKSLDLTLLDEDLDPDVVAKIVASPKYSDQFKNMNHFLSGSGSPASSCESVSIAVEGLSVERPTVERPKKERENSKKKRRGDRTPDKDKDRAHLLNSFGKSPRKEPSSPRKESSSKEGKNETLSKSSKSSPRQDISRASSDSKTVRRESAGHSASREQLSRSGGTEIKLNRIDPQVEALCQAAWDNDFNSLKSILVQSESYLNQPNSKGQTALYCASRQGHGQIVEYLLTIPGLDLDFQVEEHGGTSLHAASFYQHAEIVALLLAKGASTALKNNIGCTAQQDARGKALPVYETFRTKGVNGLASEFQSIPRIKSDRERIRKNFASSKAEGFTTPDKLMNASSSEGGSRGSSKKSPGSVVRNLSQGDKKGVIEKDDFLVVAPSQPEQVTHSSKINKIIEIEFSDYIPDYDLRFKAAQFSSRFPILLAIPEKKASVVSPGSVVAQLNPLIKPLPGYTLESPFPGAPQDYTIDKVTADKFWYSTMFSSAPHLNYLAVDKVIGPVVISVLEEKSVPNLCFVITRTKFGDQMDCIVYDTSKKKTFTIQSIVKAISKQNEKEGHPAIISTKGFRLVKDPKLVQSLCSFENSLGARVNDYKVGILYAREGQTSELEMFANEFASQEFDQFLDILGNRVSLLSFEDFNGGLDTSSRLTTGQTSLFTNWRGSKIMFHVSTMLPFSIADSQNLARKRHLGNDIILIIFQEGNTPLPPNVVSSMFTYVTIIVQPLEVDGKNSYRVAVSSRDGVAAFRPLLPDPPIFDAAQLKDFLMAKIINGERSACQSGQLLLTLQRTRSTLLADLEKTFEKAS